jgi:hypothetical protein|tara:strand:+ start:351 stop:521 length:171 start_codon:yes stop_codon:yes gene_type:complete
MNYLNKKVKIITSLIPLFIIGTMLFANQKPAKAYGPVEVCQSWVTGELYRCGSLFY